MVEDRSAAFQHEFGGCAVLRTIAMIGAWTYDNRHDPRSPDHGGAMLTWWMGDIQDAPERRNPLPCGIPDCHYLGMNNSVILQWSAVAGRIAMTYNRIVTATADRIFTIGLLIKQHRADPGMGIVRFGGLG